MRARDVVGKRIAKIHQQRAVTDIGPVWEILAIELQDGSMIAFAALDSEDDGPIVTGSVEPRPV